MTYPSKQVQSPVSHPCPNCARDWGPGIACQFCRQVGGLPQGVAISSPARRLGEFLLEGVLVLFTVVIGWIIWAAIVFKDGQTPAKQVLRMRCVKLATDETAHWGTMFVREVICKPVIGVLSWATFGIVNFWLIWDPNNQQLWDKMVGTIVVNDAPPTADVRPVAGREVAGSDVPAVAGEPSAATGRRQPETEPADLHLQPH